MTARDGDDDDDGEYAEEEEEEEEEFPTSAGPLNGDENDEDEEEYAEEDQSTISGGTLKRYADEISEENGGVAKKART